MSEEKEVKVAPKKAAKKVAPKAKKTVKKTVKKVVKDAAPVLTVLAIDAITEHKGLPARSVYTEIPELMNAIKTSGLLNPLSVFVSKSKAYLVAGSRRLRALLMLQEESPKVFDKMFKDGVPVRIVADNIEDAQLAYMSENGARVNMNHLDSATIIASSMAKGTKVSKIAKSFSKSPAWIRDHARFKKNAVKETIAALTEEKISWADAVDLTKDSIDAKTQRLLLKEKLDLDEANLNEAEESGTTAPKPTPVSAKGPTQKQKVETSAKLLSTACDAGKKEVLRSRCYLAHRTMEYALGNITEAELFTTIKKLKEQTQSLIENDEE